MHQTTLPHQFLYRWFTLGMVAISIALTSGCASYYVDTALKDVKPGQIKKVENPQPAQLIFEFQTKGVPNARATEMLKKRAFELTKNSGLFSEVSVEPASNGAIINIVVNNVPLTDNAFGKGFATGLTFGLAGNTVTDGYVCTVNYLAANSPKIVKTVRHAIHTTIGAQNAPVNAEKSDTLAAAVDKMFRQIISNGLSDLASDPAFK